ncbi:MAG: hypothetical protein WD073_05850 [Xanthobacteraceae bacterium]
MRRARRLCLAAQMVLVAAALGACATPSSPPPMEAPAPPLVPTLPPAFPPQELIGRWGHAAYHRPDDRARTEVAARNQCSKPYVIGAGTAGGVIMHLADQPQPQELQLKGHPNGKTYLGPQGEPGGPQDREVVSFDGRVLILRWIDPEIAGRYGNGVYVRCAPRA